MTNVETGGDAMLTTGESIPPTAAVETLSAAGCFVGATSPKGTASLLVVAGTGATSKAW